MACIAKAADSAEWRVKVSKGFGGVTIVSISEARRGVRVGCRAISARVATA